MLAGWRSLALQVTTQAQVRTEVVWFNFEARPGALGELRQEREQFTDRQRIKRKSRPTGNRR